MTNQDDDQIATAVDAERSRCVKLLDFYRLDFLDTPYEALWCRIRNQIAIGTSAENAALDTQLTDDSEE